MAAVLKGQGMPIRYGVIDKYKQDGQLTFAARGVAAVLYKRPGLTFDDLKKCSNDDLTTIRKAIFELRCRGYLFRYRG